MKRDSRKYLRGSADSHLSGKQASYARRYAFATVVMVLYLLAIVFGVRLSSGIRLEDVGTPLLVAAVLVLIWRWRGPWSWIVVPLLLSVYELIVTIVNVAYARLPWEGVLVWGKEAQYVIGYILIFLLLASEARFVAERWLRRIVAVSLLTASLYFLVAAGLDMRGYYGIGYFTELQSPSLSALIYFNLGVLALVFAIGARRVALWVFGAVTVLFATVMTGSRTGIVMVALLMVGMMLRGLIDLYRSCGLNGVLTGCLRDGQSERFMSAIVAGALACVVSSVALAIGRIVHHMEAAVILTKETDNERGVTDVVGSRIASMAEMDRLIRSDRLPVWKQLLDLAIERNIWTGCGQGCAQVRGGGLRLTLSGDNQHMLNLAELGVIGVVLFGAVLVWLAIGCATRYRVVYWPYIASYVVGGMAAELWRLSKGGQMFWLISAVVIAARHDLRVRGGSKGGGRR